MTLTASLEGISPANQVNDTPQGKRHTPACYRCVTDCRGDVSDTGVFGLIRKMFPGPRRCGRRWEKEEEAGQLPGGLQELAHRHP